MKDNKLIAEFMGCTNPFNEIHDATLYKVEQGTFELDELQYHESWDWLIPVIKKIDSYACEEMDFSDYDDYRNKYVFIHNISLHNDIREVYNQVVEFIKQYNKDES
jgi:hypothetical protein|tara:strand:- start:408 stop:725 length:318 start_codon:yes stop_codon:yes gene_type:complete